MSTYIREQSEWMDRWSNFELKEFVCQCGCNEVKISSALIDIIQLARTHLGYPLQITSAYRCPTHNDNVSSTGLAGPHTTGMAVDILVENSRQRKEMIDFFTNKVTGLGIAKTFLHIDIIQNEDLSHRPNCWLY